MIRAALRKATIANKTIPVTCGSSYKNKGVQELLDAIVEYMPSPLDKKQLPAPTRRPRKRKRVSRLTTSRSPPWPSRS